MSLKKILIIRFSSIGDIILTTPIIRCVKKQHKCIIHYLTKKKYLQLIDSNPYIDKCYSIKKNTNEVKSRTIYIFQVGSFKNFASADALKAKLAFSGLSAYIEKKDIIGKGISFRVFVGPFEDKKKLDKVKNILSENGVGSLVSIEQKIENNSM